MATDARRAILTGVIVALVACSGVAASATSPSRAILDRRKALDDGPRHWDDREQRVALVIHASRGGVRERDLVIYERRLPNDENQTVLFFESPSDVRGTGFLSLSRAGHPAEQWLYLPALGRVRQITAQGRTQSFVGTDLTYQDLDLLQEMPAWTEQDAASELLREEPVDDVPTHVIAFGPRRDDIGYTRIVLWLGVEDLMPRRLEFFEEGPDPVKRIHQRDIRLIGPIPVAHRVEIERPQRGSHTVMTVRQVSFDQRLEDELFTQRALERGER